MSEVGRRRQGCKSHAHLQARLAAQVLVAAAAAGQEGRPPARVGTGEQARLHAADEGEEGVEVVEASGFAHLMVLARVRRSEGGAARRMLFLVVLVVVVVVMVVFVVVMLVVVGVGVLWAAGFAVGRGKSWCLWLRLRVDL